MMGDNVPDGFVIHIKVGMGKDIPEPNDAAPGDFRGLGPEGIRETFHRFADDFEVAKDGIP